MRRRIRQLAVVATATLLVAIFGMLAFGEYSLRRARSMLAAHRPRRADEILHDARRFAIRRSEFQILRGRAARMLEDFDTAEQFLTELQQREGTASDESTLEWAMLRAQRGEMEVVEEFLRKQVDSNHAQSTLILEAMAAGYLRRYRVFDAMNCLKQWSDRGPEPAALLTLRGRAYQQVHAFSRAVADFQRALELEPDDDRFRLLLANAMVENSQAPEAVPLLETLRQRRPDDLDVAVRLAFAWNIAGRTTESGVLLDEILAKNPNLGPALSARGQLELQLRNPVAAEKALRQALAATPFDRQTNYAMFQALQQQGKEAEAEAQGVRLKKIETTISRMTEITNRLLPLKPRDPELNYELGTLLAEMGYESVAVGWFHQTLQFDAKFRPAHRWLADYHQRKGNLQQSAIHRAAAEAKPEG